MTNFLFVYYGGKMAPTPAEQKKSMDEWNAWFKENKKSVVDQGAPTMPGKLVSMKNVGAIGMSPVTGWSVFKANSMDDAIAMAKTSPQMKDGGEIAVYQVMAM